MSSGLSCTRSVHVLMKSRIHNCREATVCLLEEKSDQRYSYEDKKKKKNFMEFTNMTKTGKVQPKSNHCSLGYAWRRQKKKKKNDKKQVMGRHWPSHDLEMNQTVKGCPQLFGWIVQQYTNHHSVTTKPATKRSRLWKVTLSILTSLETRRRNPFEPCFK